MNTLTLKKSLDYLSKVFISLIAFDIVYCWTQGNSDLMYSSVICLIGLLLSRIFFHFKLYDPGSMLIVFTLYIVGFFHVIVIGNFVTCYLILISVPIVATLLLENKILRYSLIVFSSILFPLCNYYAGFSLFENYFFYYGLITCYLVTLYFINLCDCRVNSTKPTYYNS